MESEELKLLRENNQTLKQILLYLNSLDFIINNLLNYKIFNL